MFAPLLRCIDTRHNPLEKKKVWLLKQHIGFLNTFFVSNACFLFLVDHFFRINFPHFIFSYIPPSFAIAFPFRNSPLWISLPRVPWCNRLDFSFFFRFKSSPNSYLQLSSIAFWISIDFAATCIYKKTNKSIALFLFLNLFFCKKQSMYVIAETNKETKQIYSF